MCLGSKTFYFSQSKIIQRRASLKNNINEQIRAGEVRVISEDGRMLGIMPTKEALALAKSQGLDLIEIAPHASPPVVKILSYDKFRYQLEKGLQKQRKKQKKIEVKGIRLSIRIGPHDLGFKVRQAQKFLEAGSKVKLELILRGRERANLEFAYEVLRKFLKAVESNYPNYQIEQAPKRLGQRIVAVMAAKSHGAPRPLFRRTEARIKDQEG